MADTDPSVFNSSLNALPSDSLRRFKKPSRKTKLDTQARESRGAEGRKEVSVKQQVFITNGYAPEPTAPVSGPEEKPADFYRNGEAVTEDENGNEVNVAGGSLTGLSGVQYNLLPRLLEDFDDKEASIRLIGKKQGSNEEADLIPAWTKFILQQANESYTEKSQIVETFGDYYVFFFGQRPIIYNFSGTLINSKNASWLNDWKFMYQNYLRGTKSIENQARILLTYGGRQVEGYILNTSNSTSAATEKGVPFSFQVLLIDEKFINFSNDFGLVVSDGTLTEAKSFLELLTQGPLSNADLDRALQQARAVMEKSKNAAETDQAKADQQGAVENDFNIDLERTNSGGLKLPTLSSGF